MIEMISVILPAYNCEQTIEEAVASVLKQTYGDIELIIVDDGSEDKTHEICSDLAKNDKRIKLITNSVNRGRLVSRLIAVDKAESKWIAFIDSDDIWQSDKIEKQIKLRDQSECDLVYTGSAFIDWNGRVFEWVMNVPEQVDYKRLLKQNIISNSSVLVRKKDYIDYSPSIDNGKDMHEDFACWLSMLKAGLVAKGINEPLITYRISRKSVSGNKISASRMNMNTYRYLKLGFFERVFYQTCYAVNGLNKYVHFR